MKYIFQTHTTMLTGLSAGAIKLPMEFFDAFLQIS